MNKTCFENYLSTTIVNKTAKKTIIKIQTLSDRKNQRNRNRKNKYEGGQTDRKKERERERERERETILKYNAANIIATGIIRITQPR